MRFPSLITSLAHRAHCFIGFMAAHRKLVLQLSVLALSLLFLGSGVQALWSLTLFVAFVLIPVSSLWHRIAGNSVSLLPSVRSSVSVALACLCITPLYFLQKSLGAGWVADVAISLLLVASAAKWGATRELLADCRDVMARGMSIFVCIMLPLVFALTWMGFNVTSTETVRFYGLFTVDFGNLAAVVSLIRVSPMLPLSLAVDAGPLSYHWFYFAMPAWLSDFAGARMPSTTALVLCNYLVGCLLCFALHGTIVNALAGKSRVRIVMLAMGVIMFAPLVVYCYQSAVKVLGLPWFTLGSRNHNLLSILNSVTVFGNNTLALVLILLGLAMLRRWNETLDRKVLLLGAVFVSMVIPHSITLFFSLALAAGIMLVTGQIRRPLFAGGVGAAVVLTVVFTLWRLHLFGDGAQSIAISFDNGQFLQNVAFSLLPLWALALFSVRRGRAMADYWVLIGSALAVPSLLMVVYAQDDSLGGSAFAMKTSSLLIVALAPMVATGLDTLFTSPGKRFARWAIAALIVAGCLNTSVYVLQFPFYRLTGYGQRCSELPVGYCTCLEYIRCNTPRSAILLDPVCRTQYPTTWGIMLGERRVALPSEFNLRVAGNGPWRAGVEARLEDWEAWRNGGFTGDACSARLRAAADYLVWKDNLGIGNGWTRVYQSKGYAVYASQR